MKSRWLFFFAVIGCALFPFSASAQNETVLTLSVPEWLYNTIDRNTLAPFEEQHGVRVVTLNSQMLSFYGYDSSLDVQQHLDSATQYASSADVLFVAPGNVSVEATHAGLFLDLAPLVFDDPTLPIEDFYPAAWDSFQWDNGMWAVSVVAEIKMLLYDQNAFDNAGLPYPADNWTIDDFANAARTLAQTAPPGFFTYQPEILFRALLGTGFYDAAAIPAPAMFSTNADLAYMVDTWAQLESEGAVARSTPGMGNTPAPLLIDRPTAIGLYPENWLETLLPGGTAFIEPQGFAVSAGTQNPELAYELVKYLSTSVRVVDSIPGDTPARHSMLEQTLFKTRDPRIQQLVSLGLDAALPLAEMRYGQSVNNALNRVITEQIPASQALQDIEITAQDALLAAQERRANTQITVDYSAIPPMSEGEIVLRFSVFTTLSPMADRDLWETIALDFAAQDPQVGYVEILGQFATLQVPQDADCFFLPWNAVDTLDSQTIGSLDPFLDADVTFDSGDMLGNAWAQVQRDGVIWAYPIAIQAHVLWADSNAFNQAGIALPEGEWQIEQFTDAIAQIRYMTDPATPIFSAISRNNTPLLMLIAAHGGMPFDMLSMPSGINFTSPETVNAIRAVLDMAKAGDIAYQPLDTPNPTFPDQRTAIYSQTLAGIGYGSALVPPDTNLKMLLFPSGSQNTPVSYSLNTAYIHANTLNAEACYRWMQYVAQNSYRLNGVPAVASVYSDPGFTGSVSPDLQTFYQQFNAQMQASNTAIFPAYGSNSPTLIEQIWLNRAMDNYVLNNADLEAELALAEQLTLDYRACAANILPLSSSTSTDHYRQHTECATSVDPGLAGRFNI